MNPDDRELSDLIKTHATRHNAPASLKSALKAQLNLADLKSLAASSPAAQASEQPGSAARPGVLARTLNWLRLPRWPVPAAAFACGMVVMALVMPMIEQAHLQSGLDEAVVANHVRAVAVGPLIEVASSDRHTVKPWFQGKLDFAPTVLDFAGDGFALQGGRIERLKGRTVAALAYRANQHVVDVYVFPSRGAHPAQIHLVRGFAVATWADDSMQYWAVSDMDEAELRRLTALWSERTKGK